MKKSIICLAVAVLSLVGTSSTAAPLSSAAEISTLYSGTPLCQAISKGDTETVKKFIEYGADVNEMSNGMTPLMVAARYNRTEIIQLLLDRGANPRFKTETGYTALRYAELSNATEAVSMLNQKR